MYKEFIVLSEYFVTPLSHIKLLTIVASHYQSCLSHICSYIMFRGHTNIQLLVDAFHTTSVKCKK
jgi:hypothetical protein